MIIRTETQKDYDEIYHLVRDAFKTAQVSDGKEQDFVVKLRQEADYLADLAFVAEEDGRIIAHIMLTKQKVWTSSGFFEALLLAPLCVAFDHRNRGIGAELVRYAMKVATEKGYKAVFWSGIRIITGVLVLLKLCDMVSATRTVFRLSMFWPLSWKKALCSVFLDK